VTGGVDKLIATARHSGSPWVNDLADALVAAEAREKQLREALTEAVESLAMWEGGSLPPSNTLKRARAALAAGGENPADSKERM
jgi:hypothetical protein